MRVKAQLREASEYYSDLHGIPIQISARKQRDFSKDIKPDKLMIYVPASFDPMAEPEDEYDEKNLEAFENWLAKLSDQLRDMYSKEMKEINSSSDLKSLVSSWASDMGLRTPSVSLRQSASKWGSAALYTDGSCNMMLHDFLRFVPLEIAEEVVVHELVHYRMWVDLINLYGPDKASAIVKVRDNHDSEFWRMFSRYMPDHESRADKLEDLYQEMMGGSAPSYD